MIRRTKSLLPKPAVRRAQAKQLAQEHGRHIYAYCHMQTKQVLYSLSRIMNNNDMLKQLPDVGANNTPRALRKDVWRPFFTLSMPGGEQGMAQGLMAFKHLREWRKMHEVSWEVSPLLARPHTKNEIEAMRKRLEDRGGSKKENVWDLIKRAKKKMRVHAVMNQKANSVADLATVLQDLDKSGSNILRQQIHELKEDREREVQKILSMAQQFEDGGLEKLQEEILDIERQLERPAVELKGTSKSNLRTRIYQLKGKEKQMQFAAEAVSLARSGKSVPLLVKPWRKNTPEEDEKLQRRVKQLSKQLEQQLKQCLTLASSQIANIEARLEELRAQEGSSQGVRRLEYQKKLCKHNAPLADEILSVFASFGLTSRTQVPKSDPWTLEQILESVYDPARDLTLQIVDSAQDEIDVVRDDQPEGWEGQVKHLQATIKGAKADLQILDVMRNAEVKIPEPNSNAPPAELDSQAGVEPEVATSSTEPDDAPVAATSDLEVGTEERTRPARLTDAWNEFLPSFPPREAKNIPKRGYLRGKLDRLARPIFNSSHVEIRWENPLDAEYADSWPGTVAHHAMGYARHTAPDPQEDPVAGSAELRAKKEDRIAAAVASKSEKRIYLEGLQSEILEKMQKDVFAEQEEADLKAGRENRRLIKNVGLHKKAVKRRRAKEREATARDGEASETIVEA